MFSVKSKERVGDRKMDEPQKEAAWVESIVCDVYHELACVKFVVKDGV